MFKKFSLDSSVVLSLICMFGIILQAKAQNIISRQNAFEIVKDSILHGDLNNTSIYISKDVKEPNSTISLIQKSIVSPKYPSWLIFIDDYPLANWGHSCRYVFVNSDTGEYEILPESWPPTEELDTLVEFQVANTYSSLTKKSAVFNPPLYVGEKKLLPAIHHYAVIISGGINSNMNYERYWNDCSFIYTTLTTKYNYPKNNIYVIMSDGTSPENDRRLVSGEKDSSPLDLDGDGTADIQYAATKSNISNVFNELSNKLTADDDLLIFTIDHGGYANGHSFLCLWNNENMKDIEFATEVDKVNAGHIMVCMGQCNSGGFVDDLQAENRVIATACAYNKSSYASANLLHDEFVFHWTSALRGQTPDGTSVNADFDNNQSISIKEAFDYAISQDQIDPDPQYSSIPQLYGDNAYLGIPTYATITGNSVISSPSSYEIDNLPSGAKVLWEIEDSESTIFSLQQNTPSINKCTIDKDYTIAHKSIIVAKIVFNSDTILTLRKPIYSHNPSASGFCTYANGTVQDFSESAFILYPDSPARVWSLNFGGMMPNTTYNGYAGLLALKAGEYEMIISAPSNTNAFFISEDNNTASLYHVFTYANKVLKINQGENTLTIELRDSNEDTLVPSFSKQSIEDMTWNIEIYEYNNMTRKHVSAEKNKECSIDVTDWEPGVYVIRVQIGENEETAKIYIK